VTQTDSPLRCSSLLFPSKFTGGFKSGLAVTVMGSQVTWADRLPTGVSLSDVVWISFSCGVNRKDPIYIRLFLTLRNMSYASIENSSVT
jgi:hypothetical protein